MARIDLARLSDVASGIPSGTSNPGSPATNDLFHRTDLNLIIYYDGTRWVTTTLYREPFTIGSTFAPATVSSVLGRLTPWATAYDLWLVNWDTVTYVATTNDGTKYWTNNLHKYDTADATTLIASFTTAADTVNVWTRRRTAIGASYVAASFAGFRINAAPTSTPGGLYWATALEYRLIVT